MRKSGIVAVSVLTFVLGLSAIGQQVDLAVEPARISTAGSLADSIRRNDFPGFDAQYRAAVQRGERVQQFADIHRLWTWAMTHPTGAFYDTDMRNAFARAYPGYAAYIEELKIVDSNGNAFYPTAETRLFLLHQAETGVVARTEPAPAPQENRRPVAVAAQQSVAQAAPRSTIAAVPPPQPVKALPAPVAVASRAAVSSPARSSAAVEPVAVTSAIPAVSTPVVSTPVISTPPPAAPVQVTAAARPSEQPAIPHPAPAKSGESRFALGRGIFLIIAGLLALGMLTMKMHTPATRT